LSQKSRKKAMHMAEFIGELAESAGPTRRRWQLTSGLMTDKEKS